MFGSTPISVPFNTQKYAVIDTELICSDNENYAGEYWPLKTSGSTTKAALLDIVKNKFMDLATWNLFQLGLAYDLAAYQNMVNVNTIWFTIAVCGGGGSGAYGGSTGFGGFPGYVTQRTFALTDLPDSSISYVIGAGAVFGSAQSGGTSIFNSNNPYAKTCVAALGGNRGGNTDAEEQAIHNLELMRGLPANSKRRAFETNALFNFPLYSGLHGDKSPGGGGSNAARGIIGGSSSRFIAAATDGFPVFDAVGGNGSSSATAAGAGSDYLAYKFDSYGSGGGGNSSTGNAGNGGYPGGGGGWSLSAKNSGGGGNGIIKVKPFLRRLVRV